MPFILLGLIVLLACTHSYVPLEWKSFLYALSLTIKSGIIFLLPFLIFGLIFKTASSLAKTASKIILWVFVLIVLSNFISTMISFGVGHVAYSLDLSMQLPEKMKALKPAFDFTFPSLINNDKAMLLGLVLGFLLGWRNPQLASQLSEKMDRVISLILKVFFTFIPLFITGFILKMYHEKLMQYILTNYFLIFSIMAAALYTYIGLLYLFVCRFSIPECFRQAKNMLPPAITAFGSMSSAAALPLSIVAVGKNGKYPDLAKSILPVSVNIHLIGDCFSISIFAFAILKSFGMSCPDLMTYLPYAIFFVLAKFSVAAIPGGGVLVMLPILERHLGFNPTMLSLITALYILFDPVISCANVFGNGAFSTGVSNFFGKRLEVPTCDKA